MPAPRRAPTKQRLPRGRLGTRLLRPAAVTEPEQTAGTLIGWYDAQKQTGYTQGNAVSSLTNFGGTAGALTQGTGTNQPSWQDTAINGHPAVRFVTNDWMQTAAFGAAVAQPTTVVLVTRFAGASASGQSILFDGQGGGSTNRNIVQAQDATWPTANWRIWAGAFQASSSSTFDTNAHILRALYDGANSKLWVDDTLLITGASPGTNPLGGITLGSWADNPTTDFFNGDHGEVLAYQGDISAQWATLRDYLVTKWSIGAGPVTGAATGQQHTSGIASAQKQAAGAAQSGSQVSGQASGAKGTAGAAQGPARTAGATVAAKQVTAATQGAQRSSGAGTGRKQAIAAGAGPQHTSGAAAAAKGGIGSATGPQRTIGQAGFAPAGPSGAASGAQRTSGASTGAKGAVVASAGPTRTAGAAAAAKGGAGAMSGPQRTAGAGAAAKGGRGAAAGPTRTTGVAAAGPKQGSGAAQGPIRASGTAAGIHRTSGTAAGVQHTTGVAGVRKDGRGAASGPQRTDGVATFTTIPPPRWVEGTASGSGQVEGTSSGIGQVEGVLVGAGIVEGSGGV